MNLFEAQSELRPFLSGAQLALLVQRCRGEEADYFRDVLLRLAALIRSMPQTGDQEGLGENAVVSLHYFYGKNDWYILEKDVDGGVDQAFGYVVLDGDELCAELSYVSIREVTGIGAEMNLHFQPKTLEMVKLERQQEGR